MQNLKIREKLDEVLDKFAQRTLEMRKQTNHCSVEQIDKQY